MGALLFPLALCHGGRMTFPSCRPSRVLLGISRCLRTLQSQATRGAASVKGSRRTGDTSETKPGRPARSAASDLPPRSLNHPLSESPPAPPATATGALVDHPMQHDQRSGTTVSSRRHAFAMRRSGVRIPSAPPWKTVSDMRKRSSGPVSRFGGRMPICVPLYPPRTPARMQLVQRGCTWLPRDPRAHQQRQLTDAP